MKLDVELATLSPRLDFARDSLPIYWEIKLRRTLSAWRDGDWWSGPLVRHGYDLVRSWRSLLRLAEWERAALLQLARTLRRLR